MFDQNIINGGFNISDSNFSTIQDSEHSPFNTDLLVTHSSFHSNFIFQRSNVEAHDVALKIDHSTFDNGISILGEASAKLNTINSQFSNALYMHNNILSGSFKLSNYNLTNKLSKNYPTILLSDTLVSNSLAISNCTISGNPNLDNIFIEKSSANTASITDSTLTAGGINFFDTDIKKYIRLGYSSNGGKILNVHGRIHMQNSTTDCLAFCGVKCNSTLELVDNTVNDSLIFSPFFKENTFSEINLNHCKINGHAKLAKINTKSVNIKNTTAKCFTLSDDILRNKQFFPYHFDYVFISIFDGGKPNFTSKGQTPAYDGISLANFIDKEKNKENTRREIIDYFIQTNPAEENGQKDEVFTHDHFIKILASQGLYQDSAALADKKVELLTNNTTLSQFLTNIFGYRQSLGKIVRNFVLFIIYAIAALMLVTFIRTAPKVVKKNLLAESYAPLLAAFHLISLESIKDLGIFNLIVCVIIRIMTLVYVTILAGTIIGFINPY